jgi:Trypsin-co-occurring domain 1
VYIEVPLSEGQAFLVQGDNDAGVVRAGRGKDVIQSSAETFEDSLAKVGRIAEMIVQRFASVEKGPDRVRAEFGVKLAAETGMVVVKGSADAHFVLELEWSRSEKP